MQEQLRSIVAALVIIIIFSCNKIAQGVHVVVADRGFERSMTYDRCWHQFLHASTKTRREAGRTSSLNPTEGSLGKPSPKISRGFGSRASRRRKGVIVQLSQKVYHIQNEMLRYLSNIRFLPWCHLLHETNPLFPVRVPQLPDDLDEKSTFPITGDDKRHQPVAILKRSRRWACVKGCGACCYLAMNHRPDMAGELSLLQPIHPFTLILV